jgi:hypothetical protein
VASPAAIAFVGRLEPSVVKAAQLWGSGFGEERDERLGQRNVRERT